MSFTDPLDVYKNYNHADNWMSNEEAKYLIDMEASEQQEKEADDRQKYLDDYFLSL